MVVTLLVGISYVFSDRTEASSDATSNSCINCHQSDQFFVQNKKLYNYYQDWLQSPHRQAGVVCNDCHGGNPKASSKVTAHQGVLDPSSSTSRVFFKNQPATCGECHESEVNEFIKSDHYKGLMGDSNAPTCSTCHRTMNRRPYFTTVVEATCEICHYEGNEDDLPLVGRKAEKILHRLNSTKGYLNWTNLYYRDKNWPGNSKDEVEALQQAYKNILTSGHSFDLSVPDEASIELLTKLKQIYREVEGKGMDDNH
jgi:hypothetical protein